MSLIDDLMREPMPSAYAVQQMRDGRWYPMRFGKFRLDARGYRISYDRREDAELMCKAEQRDYVRAYPCAADGRGK